MLKFLSVSKLEDLLNLFLYFLNCNDNINIRGKCDRGIHEKCRDGPNVRYIQLIFQCQNTFKYLDHNHETSASIAFNITNL